VRDQAASPRALIRKGASATLGGISGVLGPLIGLMALGKGTADYLKLRYVDFRPRPDDIFIATYPRSGTTWMQMLLYQMTSDGSMDFEHISEVCPWFERSIVSERDLNALASPRVFKTHLRHYLLPGRPCRYIYVVRDGKDVAVSYFHFYCSHFGFTKGLPEFFNMFLRGKVQGGSWFTHVSGWWAHREDPNVLFLHYEDLIGDLEGSIRTIAGFCGLALQADDMPRILNRAGFAFMKQHESKFDHINEVLWEQGMRQRSFLRSGTVGEGAKGLSPTEQALFDQQLDKKLRSAGLEFENRRAD
jgi:hypothetical protein